MTTKLTTEPAPKQYTTRYRVMLVLSTIGTTYSGLSLFSLPEVIGAYHIAPIYSIAVIALSVVTLVSIAALVLLYKKQIEGYYLKIGSYVASIVFTTIAMFGLQPYIKIIAEEALMNEPRPAVDPALFSTIVNGLVYTGLTLSIITSVTFMILWMVAWKRQMKADGAQ